MAVPPDLKDRVAELEEIVRKLTAPLYLQASDGWYAISLGKPKYCFHGPTLDDVKAKEGRALAFYSSHVAGN